MEHTDTEIKKKYIYENIGKLSNHRNYLDIVYFHNCSHTNNSNGIFLNLNTIEIDVVDKIYYKLKNEIEDDDFNTNIIEKQIIEEETHVIEMHCSVMSTCNHVCTGIK